jgi:hypothetical protein
MVSIMPGIENFAPDRHETRRGLSGLPNSFFSVCLDSVQRFELLLPDVRREFALFAEIGDARFGRYGEAWRDGDLNPRHLCQIRSFATE